MASDMVPGGQVLRVDEEREGLILGGSRNTPRKRGRNKGNGSNDLQLAQMKAHMSLMWANGESYPAIAEQISDTFELEGEDRLSANNIAYHIKQMLKLWRERSMVHMDDKQAAVLARYEQIESLATEAYFASMQGQKTTVYKKQMEKARSKEREAETVAQYREEKRKIMERNKKRKKKGKKLLPLPKLEDFDMMDQLIETQEKIEEMEKMEEKRAGDPRFLQIIVDINKQRAHLWGLLHKTPELGGNETKMSDEDKLKRLANLISGAKSRAEDQMGRLAPPGPMGGFEAEDVPDELKNRAEALGLSPDDDDIIETTATPAEEDEGWE
jgi:hypothetical protein